MYLTESSLKEFIKTIFPNENLIFNKKCFLGFLPDIYIPSKNIIIEFDGYYHYSKSDTILKDIYKDKLCLDNGIKMIRIPYFVQLSKESILHFFNINIEDYDQSYQHGFIDDKALLPSDFCSLGVSKFYTDLYNLPRNISLKILESLKHKIQNSKHGYLGIIPNSMVLDSQLVFMFGKNIVDLI